MSNALTSCTQQTLMDLWDSIGGHELTESIVKCVAYVKSKRLIGELFQVIELYVNLQYTQQDDFTFYFIKVGGEQVLETLLEGRLANQPVLAE